MSDKAAEPHNSFYYHRINRLARMNRAQSYLEVGVSDGATFFNVEIADKTAVDPRFRFDAAARQTPAQRFHEMTSDAFFSLPETRAKKFDFIFLDGLHTFEQTFRDFCALAGNAHDDTIWMIDDVYPTDIFSALRDQKQAAFYRKERGGAGASWHGDVYKTVLAIHDFFPNFSLRTFATGGNRQTVLIRRPRQAFRALLDNLEQISRTDYFWMRENDHFFGLLPPEDLFAWAADILDR